jgi:hypothetical protein
MTDQELADAIRARWPDADYEGTEELGDIVGSFLDGNPPRVLEYGARMWWVGGWVKLIAPTFDDENYWYVLVESRNDLTRCRPEQLTWTRNENYLT